MLIHSLDTYTLTTMEATQHAQRIHNFCLNRREVEEIHEKIQDFGRPNVCFIVRRYEKFYLLLYLDPVDYYAYFFDKTPLEDIMEMDDEDDEDLFQRLQPKVIEVLTNQITISLRNRVIKVPSKEYIRSLASRKKC